MNVLLAGYFAAVSYLTVADASTDSIAEPHSAISEPSSVSGPPLIGLVLHGLELPVYQKLEENAREYCRTTGKCRLVSGGGLGSQDETSQRVWLKQLVAERVAGIVVAPVGGQKLLKQLAKARKKGITVVNIGGRFDPEMLTRNRLLIPWVGPDNSAAARAVAQLLVQRLRPEARVAILAGTPGHQVSYERVRAARAWLKSCGLKVVAIEAAHWQKGRAEATTMDLLSRFPDLDAILAVNDEMALGALKAVGRVKPGRVLITGFDGEKRALNLIRAGKMLATIDWYPDQQGVYGIQKLLSGTAGDKMTPWRLLIREDLVGHGFEIGSTGTDQ